VALGLAAEVKQLALFHHDPERSDDAIDAITAEAAVLVGKSAKHMKVFSAREGEHVYLP
jgi:phosphoribosyl 1,2-cyclic phosphodiesterase